VEFSCAGGGSVDNHEKDETKFRVKLQEDIYTVDSIAKIPSAISSINI